MINATDGTKDGSPKIAEDFEEMAELYVRESGKKIHSNCCATSRAPAREPGPCDCDVETDSSLQGAEGQETGK